MLPAGEQDEVLYTTSCKHSLALLRMDEIIIVASSWLFILFLSMMHGHTNIKQSILFE